jgi:hypothetical protein
MGVEVRGEWVQARPPAPRCPLCREDLVPAAPDLELCPGCASVAHRECLATMSGGRCPVAGCRAQVLDAAIAPPEPEVPPSPRDPGALFAGASALAFALGALYVYLGKYLYGWPYPHAVPWEACSGLALGWAAVGIGVAWGRPARAAGTGRGLAMVALALAYPPLVALTLCMTITAAGIVVFGFMRTGGARRFSLRD